MIETDKSDAADAARFRYLVDGIGFEHLLDLIADTPRSHWREQLDNLRNQGQMLL